GRRRRMTYVARAPGGLTGRRGRARGRVRLRATGHLPSRGREPGRGRRRGRPVLLALSPDRLAAGDVAPFGSNVHILMPAWLPADRGEVPAVITAKNFLLAFLYAEYKGNQDHRWAIYV